MEAYLAGVACHVPAGVETGDALGREHPEWDVARIERKTGIRERHLAGPDERASDLAAAAANRLFDTLRLDRRAVDFLLFCTQSPDQPLPTTACVLQHRLELPTSCGALDFNLGCSGYVYGLSLAKALVVSGAAKNVLLLTGETYSRWIDPEDRSVRTIFGDGGSASWITAGPEGARLGAFALGTDGAGHRNLIVRPDAKGDGRLFMDGPELFTFTLQRVPEVVRQVLGAAGLEQAQVDRFVFHQANAFMNEHLRAKLGVHRDRAPLCLERFGNTVSTTIPLTLCEAGGAFQEGERVMLVGFGVGYSWGACLLEWGRTTLVEMPA